MRAMSIARPLALLLALAAGPAVAQAPPPLIPLPRGGQVAAEVPPCQPRSLFTAMVRNITPGIAAADQRAQPKRIWRLGSRFLRSMEQPAAPKGDQAVVIVAEPDIWMLNPATRQGRHAVDKGPVLDVRAPILPPGGPKEFMALEFGCEAEFVSVRAPNAERAIRWGAIEAGLHTYAQGDFSVAILMDDLRGTPLMISYLRQGQPIYVLRYDDYRKGLPDQPELFQPPQGFTITEAPSPPGS